MYIQLSLLIIDTLSLMMLVYSSEEEVTRDIGSGHTTVTYTLNPLKLSYAGGY